MGRQELPGQEHFFPPDRLARQLCLVHKEVSRFQQVGVCRNQVSSGECHHIAWNQIGYHDLLQVSVAQGRCRDCDLKCQLFRGVAGAVGLYKVQGDAEQHDGANDERATGVAGER